MILRSFNLRIVFSICFVLLFCLVSGNENHNNSSSSFIDRPVLVVPGFLATPLFVDISDASELVEMEKSPFLANTQDQPVFSSDAVMTETTPQGFIKVSLKDVTIRALELSSRFHSVLSSLSPIFGLPTTKSAPKGAITRPHTSTFARECCTQLIGAGDKLGGLMSMLASMDTFSELAPGRNLSRELTRQRWIPLDWRIGLESWYGRNGLFRKAKKAVEELYEETGYRVAIVGHSTGGIFTTAFLHSMSARWRAKYIAGSVLATVPFAGTAKVAKTLVSGEYFEDFTVDLLNTPMTVVLDPEPIRRAVHSWTSLPMLLPRAINGAWKNDPYLFSDTELGKRYRISETERFLDEMVSKDAARAYRAYTPILQHVMEQGPGVRTIVVVAKKPKSTRDWDGTVQRESALAPVEQWGNKGTPVGIMDVEMAHAQVFTSRAGARFLRRQIEEIFEADDTLHFDPRNRIQVSWLRIMNQFLHNWIAILISSVACCTVPIAWYVQKSKNGQKNSETTESNRKKND